MAPKHGHLLREIAKFMKLNGNQSGEIKGDPELIIGDGFIYRQIDVLWIEELEMEWSM